MPPRVKALVRPELLVWGRESAGFLPQEAAERLGIAEDRLVDWERGADAPTIPQLRKLAALYRRPLAVFYLQEVPSDFMVLRDLRRLPGTGFQRLPPELQYEIRNAAERRQLALELLEANEIPIRPFIWRAELTENPEDVGERIRAALEVTDQLQREWRSQDGRKAFNAWRGRMESLGVLIFQATRLESDEASGFAIAEDVVPVVVVNRKDAPTRRTFSLLHEFVHLMLRVSGVSDWATDDARAPEDQRIEIFCNRAAASALVPRATLLADEIVVSHGANSTSWSDQEIRDLARNFGVSAEALLRRLLTLGRTTQAFYAAKREQYLADFRLSRERERQRTSRDGIPRNIPQETISNVGKPLVGLILGSYREERITLSEVAGYLGIKTKHVPKLQNGGRA